MGKLFDLKAPFAPYGDQIKAIERLTFNLENGVKEQTLLGATGTGKTFTIANVINNIDKPVLVLAHNKTLAGQLYSELKKLFPNNRVEYFISYYDYYQPEAYVPSKDMYIEKDASINDEIDEMRHAATSSILERRDTIIVASVSCIYGIGDPDDYANSMITLRVGEAYGRNHLLEQLVEMQYTRSTYEFIRGSFRVKGDNVDIIPASEHAKGIRVSFFDDEIEKISAFDVASGKTITNLKFISIFPATHFMTNPVKLEEAIKRIQNELEESIKHLCLEDYVQLLGFRRDVADVFAASDIYVFPSHQEGLPVALMEAMSVGMPVVCSKIRGNIDLIQDGEGGYLFDSKNAKSLVAALNKALVDNDTRRAQMGAVNIETMKEFDKEKVNEIMRGIYDSLTHI